jgi:hypothetical protein
MILRAQIIELSRPIERCAPPENEHRTQKCKSTFGSDALGNRAQIGALILAVLKDVGIAAMLLCCP